MSFYNLSEGDERLISQILEKSMVDPDFRQGLIDNPQQTIAEVLGYELPSKIGFTEKPEEFDIYVVLPDPVVTDVELSEAELEAVAGGVTDWCACTDSQTCECTLFSCIFTGDKAEEVQSA